MKVNMNQIAIYPGSFDPVTNGHLDIIKRAAKLYDHLIIAVASNMEKKTPLFTIDERINMLREVCSNLPNVEVDSFKGLLVDYAKKRSASTLVKGLRAVSDFEYELQMALTNRKLNPDVETIFMMTAFRYIYLSSSIVKQVALVGGNTDGMVPPLVAEKLIQKAKELGRE